MDIAVELLAIAAIIAANGFFVVAEYAVVTARRSALEQRVQEGSRGARIALRLMDDPVRVISAVQIGITALGILLGAVGEPVMTAIAGEVLPSWAALVIGFLVVTYLSVAFGELVPKALALATAERVAVLVARPIDLFARVCRPAVWALELTTRTVLRPLGVPAVTAGERPMSRDELRGVLLDAEKQGALHAGEEDMLTGVIDLRTRQARDVMRPWEDVAYLRADAEAGAALEIILQTAHSRYPVVAGEAEVVGVLHTHDIRFASKDHAPPDDLDVRALSRPPVIVPPTVRVDELLRSLRRARQQMAIVIDEYGRPMGLATLEDILEEIVGEIEDEFDDHDARFERRGEGEWLIDAAVSVIDVNRRIGSAIDPGRARSIGGLLLDHFGRVPREGERVTFDGTVLEVSAVDGQRIERVHARAEETSPGTEVVDPA